MRPTNIAKISTGFIRVPKCFAPLVYQGAKLSFGNWFRCWCLIVQIVEYYVSSSSNRYNHLVFQWLNCFVDRHYVITPTHIVRYRNQLLRCDQVGNKTRTLGNQLTIALWVNLLLHYFYYTFLVNLCHHLTILPLNIPQLKKKS